MRPTLALALLVILAACAGSPQAGDPNAYVVFFPFKSVALDPAGVEIIAQAATAAKATTGRVEVLGWTSNAGSLGADAKLSQDRARRVADALVLDGVAKERITQAGRGRSSTDPGVESRRVEIRLVP